MSQELIATAKDLEARGVRFVRFVWTDNAGLIRAKAVSTVALRNGWNRGTTGIAQAQQAVPASADQVAEGAGLTPAGEVFLRPDWSTLKQLPYAPTHARVMTDLYLDDQPWMLCPRTFLKRAIERAAAQDLRIVASFENEFYLLKPVGQDWLPVDSTLFAQTAALDLMAPLLDEICGALEAQGIQPELLHAESGPGQFELPVRCAPALAAADQQVAFRETVGAVAARHGLRASFVPKIFPNYAGSGAHVHLSLWRGGENLMGHPSRPGQLAELGAAFVAGVLNHLPALMALTTPLPNSFKRIAPHCWSGAFTAWGYGNREAAIRVPQPAAGEPISNVEIKTVDPTCNPYLALGAISVAGIDGVERQLRPGAPVDADPGDLSEPERQRLGIHELPRQLEAAIHRFEHDDLLRDALGEGLWRAVLAIRRADNAAMKGLSHADEVRLLAERF